MATQNSLSFLIEASLERRGFSEMDKRRFREREREREECEFLTVLE
jgi:hypothetical protein